VEVDRVDIADEDAGGAAAVENAGDQRDRRCVETGESFGPLEALRAVNVLDADQCRCCARASW